ncbi:unnamed protein product [marine sediment metagenome]|uniref:Uncharacterized protein n=1 Tax=marine sediment metagenome TaxID=412755 RepID=X1CI94_9ZZZZ
MLINIEKSLTMITTPQQLKERWLTPEGKKVRQQLRHKSITSTTIYTQTAWQFEGHKALNGFEL